MRIGWLAALILCGSTAFAGTVEMDAVLFVQNGVKDGILVMWIPKPLEKFCLGKTERQCSTMDYCIRTTNKNVPMCKNLGRLPAYPAEMHPRRVLAVTYFKIVPKYSPIKGIEMLQTFYNSQPRASLDLLSDSVRITARVKLTTRPDDDDFEVLEILGVSPLPN
ncbi:MAG TPA: hypothetical protein VK752_26445 [Bryobacteraceae bacterium]|jgi:hypothetical protein|nr:hypothetical protein [Bryobacteraceae bacterium]